jgi:hypothetical protein
LAAFRQALRQGFDSYVYLTRLQGCHFSLSGNLDPWLATLAAFFPRSQLEPQH